VVATVSGRPRPPGGQNRRAGCHRPARPTPSSGRGCVRSAATARRTLPGAGPDQTGPAGPAGRPRPCPVGRDRPAAWSGGPAT